MHNTEFPELPLVRHQDKEAITQALFKYFKGLKASYLVDTAGHEANHLYRLSVDSEKYLTIGKLKTITVFLSGFIAGRHSL